MCCIWHLFNYFCNSSYCFLFPFITLAIFGYLTHRNMRKIQNHVQPLAQNTTDANNTFRRRDRDLLIIIISEVAAYIITAIFYPIILLETTISQYVLSKKSVQYSQIESCISTIAYLLLYLNSALPFYVYIISSKLFRQNFKKLIINTYKKIRGKPLVETASKIV